MIAGICHYPVVSVLVTDVKVGMIAATGDLQLQACRRIKIGRLKCDGEVDNQDLGRPTWNGIGSIASPVSRIK